MARRPLPSRTIIWFFAGCAAILGGVVTFNAVVDPFGVIHQWKSASKGDLRQCAYEQRRTVKALQIFSGTWDELIIGSSREEWGIDPDHPIFDGTKTYNAALPGATYEEYAALIRFAAQNQPIERVLIDLDPMAFARTKAGGAGDFDRTPLAGGSVLVAKANYLLNPTTVMESYKWLAVPLKKFRRVCKSNGNRSIGDRPKTEKYFDYFKRSTRVMFEAHSQRLAGYAQAKTRLSDFGLLLRDLLERGIELDLFLPPNHAVFGEYLRATGWQDNYVQFRRDATALVAELSKRPGSKIRIWDFSGYNDITTEPISGVELDASAAMTKYYDVLHVQPSVLTALVCRIREYRPEACAEAGRADYGAQLRPDMLEAWELKQSEDRERFVLEHPKVLQFVEEMRVEAQKKGKAPKSDSALEQP
jgi:hypothetical protein